MKFDRLNFFIGFFRKFKKRVYVKAYDQYHFGKSFFEFSLIIQILVIQTIVYRYQNNRMYIITSQDFAPSLKIEFVLISTLNILYCGVTHCGRYLQFCCSSADNISFCISCTNICGTRGSADSSITASLFTNLKFELRMSFGFLQTIFRKKLLVVCLYIFIEINSKITHSHNFFLYFHNF